MPVQALVTPEIIKTISSRIRSANGQAYLVGGAVCDLLLGKSPKDWDIEVYGISLVELEALFQDLGARRVGASFSIVKLASQACGDVEIDLNTPTQSSLFELPAESIKEAARRRDFTINSLALNLENGNVLDYFEAMPDIAGGVLRATDPKLFVEDPLRLYRTMQLLARKARHVTPDVLTLCKSLRGAILPRERIYEEWRKLLLYADRPSIGLNFLRDIEALPEELSDLIGCPQHPIWHPEGDVWIHTNLVVDAAASIRHFIPDDWQEAFMWGCLLHDVGKPSTTCLNSFTAYGHDVAGAKVARCFMEKLTTETELIMRVEAIVANHLQPHFLAKEAGPGAYRRLHNKLRLDVLAYVSVADYCGRPGRSPLNEVGEHLPAQLCLKNFSELGKSKIASLVKGRHLIERGFKPGPDFSKRLSIAYEAQLDDPSMSFDALLNMASQNGNNI